MVTKVMKTIVSIIIFAIVFINVNVNVYAQSSKRLNIFSISNEMPDIVEKYGEEKELGVMYINNRICVTIGNELEGEIGDYIYIKLEDNHVAPCIVCDKTDINSTIISIIANSEKDFISLGDLNENWQSKEIIEISSIDINHKEVVGKQLAEYAQEFVGNPYVWGGTSLTNGADCSGFVLTIFDEFGISGLPHNAEAQATYGVDVTEEDLKPGDLLFYNDDSGAIGHVAIYIGDDQIVHASNSAPYPEGGIKISQYNYRDIACIRRLF